MSLADKAGKTPTPGVTGLVQLGIGFAREVLGQDRRKKYKIDGQRVSKEQFGGGGGGNVLQQAMQGAVAQRTGPFPPYTGPKPSDPGYIREPGERRVPPLKKSPPAKPPQGPTDADRPRAGGPGGRPVPPVVSKAVQGFMRLWLGRAGLAVSATATVAYLVDLWFRTFPGQPLPDKPPPRGGTGSQGGKGTQRPQLPPEIVFSPTINVNIPAPKPAPPQLPAPPTVATPIPQPIPRAPAPTPAPAPRPTPAPTPTRGLPTWATYAPALLPLLLSSSSTKRRRRSTPGTAPGLTPGIVPGLGLAPSPADFPLFSGGSYFDSTPQQRNCDCDPKKKRKPRKKRTKCYTGRFTERANGLRKYEKRAIKCR